MLSPNPSTCIHCGSPYMGKSGDIYAERGEFFQSVTDLAIPGRPGADAMVQFAFRRHYRAQTLSDTPMGHNWDHNYFERLLSQIDGSVIHNNGLGRNDRYLKNNVGQFVAPPEFYTKLTRNPDHTFTLRYRGGTTKQFDTDGKLLEIRDRNNNFMSFFYNAQRQLIRVNETLGRDISYHYIVGGPNDGRLSDITDYNGRKVGFTYDSNGDLVAATSPPVIGTPNGNDFPNGKTTRYTYSSGFSDARLNHNLITITRPNEVADAGPPALVNVYGTDPGSFSFDKVVQQTYGGINASGVPAGGQFTFTYTELNPGVTSDDPDLAVSRMHMTDRNGNVKEFDFNQLGYPLAIREFTRGVRPTDPPVYVTTMRHNADGRLLQDTLPAGNQMVYQYDEGNADRFQEGNLLRETHLPDARGGDQTFLITTYSYEARFNQIKTMTDPRGNDPSFIPPNGGSTSPARYTTMYTFDYEASGPSNGNIVRKQQPTVLLPDSTFQSIITDYTYNQFGELASETDPEGNVTQYFYFPESDPDGDGIPDGTRPGLNTTTGGYLKQKIIDAATSPRRTESAPPAQISNQFFYDPVGNIIRTIDGRGHDKLFVVNALNQVVRTQSEAPYRYIQDTFYDANDNVVQKSIENRVAVTSDGKPVFANGGDFSTQRANVPFFQHRYAYDILDKLVKKDEDATGSTPSRLITNYRYDANENLTQEIFPEGNIFATAYDERDLKFTVTRGFGTPQASTFTYSYDQNRNLVLMLDGRSNPTTYQFDGYDRKVGSIDAVGNQMTRNYDPNNNMVKESRFGPVGGPGPNVLLSQRGLRPDELNRVYQYDDLLFVAAGVVTVRPPMITPGPLNPGNVSIRFIFDRNGRAVQEIEDDLDTTLRDYDGVNRPVKITDPEANTESHIYDANNNLIQTVEIEKSQKAGVATETFTTRYVFDARNRLTGSSDNCQNTRRSAYDSRDNLTHQTDAKTDATLGCPGIANNQGNSMRHTYDGVNRVVQTVEDLRVTGVGSGPIDTSNPFNPSGLITGTLAYDGNSRLKTLTDNNGNATTYAYDALNRLTAEVFADGSMNTYIYDRDDNVIAFTDNNGTVVNSTYDAINRRVRKDITRAAGVIGTTLNLYEYDGLSRMTKMTDNNDPADPASTSTVLIAYDSLGRVVEENQNGRAVDSAWFAEDERVGLTYPNSRKLVFTFDALDRIKTIQDSGTPTNIVQYTYLGRQRVLERLYQNGVRQTYLDNAGLADIGYDELKRTIALRHLRSDNSLVVGFTHAYDRENNKNNEEKLHSLTNSELYAYDSAYRITSFERGQLSANKDRIVGPPNETQAWTLDGVGNWRVNIFNGLPETRTVNNVNEYTAIDATSLFHDKNGNLVNDGSFGFRWDYENRLQQACLLDPHKTYGLDGIPGTADDCLAPGALPLATYNYDAMNRRFRKVVANSGALNGITSFYYDGWRAVEERTGTDLLTQQYVYGVHADEPAVLDRNLDGDNNANGAGDQRLFYHQNTLRSVFALTDRDEAVVEGYQYDAYGRGTVFAGAFRDSVGVISDFGNPFTFTGQRLDGETGLLYYKSRYYSTALGRFLSRDPIGFDGSAANLYEYGSSNPINRIDPLGKADGESGGGASGGASSGGGSGGSSEKKDCCCCCASNLRIAKSEKQSDGQWGHGFEVRFTLEYKTWTKQGTSPCTLQWWEHMDYVSDEQAAAGIKKDVWQDMYAKFPKGTLTSDMWNKVIGSRTCPSKEDDLVISDFPRGPLSRVKDPKKPKERENLTWMRTLYFAVHIDSTCPECTPQTIYAIQFLSVTDGVGGSQNFKPLDKLPIEGPKGLR